MSVNPRLRRNLRFIEQIQDGMKMHVVKDVVSLKYYRFGANEAALMHLMDGSRSLQQIVDAAESVLGFATSTEAVDRFVRRLKEMGLAERTQEERSALLMEFVHRARQARMQGHGATVLRMRFSLGDPDALLGRMNTAFSFFFTPAFIATSVVLFIAYVLVVATHWSDFTAGVGAMYTLDRYTLGFVVMLYATTVVVFLIHEFGHGLTCKHFGGEVHEIGVMLVYFMPAFYCNVNDAWMFERRAHRLWVTFAGGWIQLVLASVAALIWIVTENGTLIHQISFLTLLIGGGLTILINFNPLIPLDGYYALVDWLGMPNLRARAFAYFNARVRHVLRPAAASLPTVTEREARIFVTYAALAIVYITAILTLLAFGVGGWLFAHWGWWGAALFLMLVWRVTGKLRRNLQAAWTNLRVAPILAYVRNALTPRYAVGIVLALLLVLVAPWQIQVSAPAVAEPLQYAALAAPEAARVVRVFTTEGALVRAGQAVALLRSAALELERSQVDGAIAALEHALASARSRSDDVAVRSAGSELAARQELLRRIDARRAALVLRAPFDARVASAHVDTLLDANALPGRVLLELQSSGPLRARVSLAERDVAHIGRGNRVRLKFPVAPAWTWQSRVAEIAPAARNGYVDVLVPLAHEDINNPLMPGMSGVAKITSRRTTVAGAAVYAARRILRTDLLL